MFPLAMGVVMALFGMSNGLHAAETGTARPKRALSPMRFYASVSEISQAEHLPTPEEDAFAQLKENELKRVGFKQYINEETTKPNVSIEKCELALTAEEALFAHTEKLAVAYKEAAGLESPKHSEQSEKLAQIKDKWQEHLTDMRMILADNEDTLNRCRRKKDGVLMRMRMYESIKGTAKETEQAALNAACEALDKEFELVNKEANVAMVILEKLFKQVHAVRMSIAKCWHFDFRLLNEGDVGSYHVEAFKHYMHFERAYHELEKNILKQL